MKAIKFAKGQIWSDNHNARADRIFQVLVVKSSSVIVKSNKNRITEIGKDRFRNNRYSLVEDRIVWANKGQPLASDLTKYTRSKK
ncbi:unnamed protein product [marine sediment metagenome]|uniref:Uncharacterized protein n=1 Tax=marine sediment metagenome TaxID=412755 RepID=X0U2Y8_9ZZZZ